MPADGGACELEPVALARDADEREIRGAAADIAHQHGLAIGEDPARLGRVARNPGVEGRRGLLEQRNLTQTGFAGGGYRQLARLLVE